MNTMIQQNSNSGQTTKLKYKWIFLAKDEKKASVEYIVH